MTGEYTVENIAFETFEWRSHDVLAKAGDALVTSVVAQARTSFLYLKLLVKLRALADSSRDLVWIFHEPTVTHALEHATAEDLRPITSKMAEIDTKLGELFSSIRCVKPPRLYRSLYRNAIEKIKRFRAEFAAHRRSFESDEQRSLLLSKADQEFLIAMLGKVE